MADEHHDLLARFIHGIVGAVFGGLVGVGGWLLWFGDAPAAVVIGIPAAALAVIAFVFGDAFWNSIGSHWWPW